MQWQIFKRSQLCMIPLFISASRFVEFDTSNLPCTVHVGRFLSRVSYILWHVFLRRRHSFTSKKLFELLELDV